MRKGGFIVALFLAVCGMTACDSHVVFDKYEHTPIVGWEKNDTLSFDIPPMKHTALYREELGLRINGAFPFKSQIQGYMPFLLMLTSMLMRLVRLILLIQQIQLMRSQAPLGAQDILDPGIFSGRHIQSFGKSFEHGLNDMMVIFTRQNAEVQVHGCRIGYRIEKLLYQLCVKLSHRRGSESVPSVIKLHGKIGAAAQVDSAQHKRLIHREDKITVAADAGLISDSSPDGFSEHDSGVLYQVVAVHFQVSPGIDVQIKHAVAGKRVQHMVKKADSGTGTGSASAIQLQSNPDICLAGSAADISISHSGLHSNHIIRFQSARGWN